MRAGLATCIVTAACRFGFAYIGDAANADAADLSSFELHKQITIAASLTTSQLADFPLLVATTDPDLAAAVRPDGADLAFVSTSGVGLPFELESWNQSTGVLIAWVRVPSIAAGTTTSIELRYRNPTLTTSPANAAATWQGYRGVWHVDDNPQGTAPQIRDRSPAQDHGTVVAGGGTIPTAVPGMIGDAIDLDGVDDWIDLGSPGTVTGFVFTASAWARDSPTASGNDYIVDYAGEGVGPAKISLVMTDGNARLTTRNDALQLQEFVGVADLRGAWHYLVGTGDGTTARLYVDGALVGSYALPTPPITTTLAALGRHHDVPDCCWFAGTLDELRFAEGVVHDAAWIAAEARNQSAPTTYVMIGPQQ